ncbi:unnamed protein product [Rangifer tarandus platyrhynchus]|uniref:Histo-blood group ABO system transferase n=1 Tax=Rangifer tarandus platyrhynchus TaxID=3082113 RepID=A0ABN8ZPZ5_RANTA|nr:unnamed protein product [Rangifer tarandus platyrhynchus]
MTGPSECPGLRSVQRSGSPCDCPCETQALRASGLPGTWTPQDPHTGACVCPPHRAQLSERPQCEAGWRGAGARPELQPGRGAGGTLRPGAAPGGEPGHQDLTPLCVCPGPAQALFLHLIWGPLAMNLPSGSLRHEWEKRLCGPLLPGTSQGCGQTPAPGLSPYLTSLLLPSRGSLTILSRYPYAFGGVQDSSLHFASKQSFEVHLCSPTPFQRSTRGEGCRCDQRVSSIDTVSDAPVQARSPRVEAGDARPLSLTVLSLVTHPAGQCMPLHPLLRRVPVVPAPWGLPMSRGARAGAQGLQGEAQWDYGSRRGSSPPSLRAGRRERPSPASARLRPQQAPGDPGLPFTETRGKSTKSWLGLILLFAALLGFYSQDENGVALQRTLLEKEPRAGLGVHGSSPPERGSPQAGLSPSAVASLRADWAPGAQTRPAVVSEVSSPSFPPPVASPGHTAELSRHGELSSVGAVTGWPSGPRPGRRAVLLPVPSALSALFSSLSEGDGRLDTCRIPEVPRLLYPKAQLLKPSRVDVLVMTPWFAPIIWDGTFDSAILDAQFRDTTIGLTVFAIKKYVVFLRLFLETAEKYFMVGHKVTYYVFTDRPADVPQIALQAGRQVVVLHVGSYRRWQDISMHRMEMISNFSRQRFLREVDYLVCLDVDMKFSDHVGVEILAPLFGTLHPGFYAADRQSFTYERRPLSRAYIPRDEGDFYYAEAFSGGRSLRFTGSPRPVTRP